MKASDTARLYCGRSAASAHQSGAGLRWYSPPPEVALATLPGFARWLFGAGELDCARFFGDLRDVERERERGMAGGAAGSVRDLFLGSEVATVRFLHGSSFSYLAHFRIQILASLHFPREMTSREVSVAVKRCHVSGVLHHDVMTHDMTAVTRPS